MTHSLTRNLTAQLCLFQYVLGGSILGPRLAASTAQCSSSGGAGLGGPAAAQALGTGPLQ